MFLKYTYSVSIRLIHFESFKDLLTSNKTERVYICVKMSILAHCHYIFDFTYVLTCKYYIFREENVKLNLTLEMNQY